MEYFTRMKSDTGINMVISTQEPEKDGSYEMMINYLDSINEDNGTGIVGNNIYIGDMNINEPSEFFGVIHEIINDFGFKWVKIWFDADNGPPIMLSANSFTSIPLTDDKMDS